MKTLQHYLDKAKLSNGDVRYFPAHLVDELSARAEPCTGSLREKLEWVRYGRVDYPACEQCAAKLTSSHWDIRFCTYRLFCGKSCAAKHRQASQSYKENNLLKYGVEHPLSAACVQQKRIATNLDKYGRAHPHPWNSDVYSEFIQTKHGVPTVRHVDGVSEKIVSTILEKTKIEFLSRLASISTEYECLTDLSKLVWISNRSIDQVLKWKHSCGKIFESPILNRDGVIKTRVCPSCAAGTSQMEQTLFNFVKDIRPDTVSRDRTVIKPLELDIYVPSLKLGIEFDGTYWHSAKFVNEADTQKKFLKCHDAGIRLITVTESSFVIRPELVEARLIHALGQNLEKIYARKCELVSITAEMKNLFFKRFHLDGDARSSIAYGLMFNGELVAAMSFGRSRFSRRHEWEIIRAASVNGKNIVGGVSRLIKHFIRSQNPRSLITYADLEWGVGHSYQLAGMNFSHFTKPGYFYVSKTNEVVTRYQAQKGKLAKLLGENFNPFLTEVDNMKNAGFIQVFDKGNAVYEWAAD